MSSTIPRPEYPRPQFVRDEWLCLNGEWQFEIDQADSGFERGLLHRPLQDKILVPFCPESKMSGIENTDFLEAVWYRRFVEVPSSWHGKRILLHFEACDYDTTVWIKKSSGETIEVGRHRGGFTPFTCNLEGAVDGGDTVEIIVRARDSHLTPQPRGKQSQRYENYFCFYTRTTGIWQTVWMEPVSHMSLRRPRLTPSITDGVLHLQQRVMNCKHGLTVKATLRDEDGVVCEKEQLVEGDLHPRLLLQIPPDRLRLWCPNDPHLYDLDVALMDENGETLDFFRSYAGMRGISIEGKAIKLNGETLFQRLVLDQGYWPDTLMTAPTDEDLRRDIELGQQAGFNGARLHQKVFEERYLYWADKMGYLCWGEFPDWGCRGLWPDEDNMTHGITFAAQWMEAMDRDYSHPAIIGWCPLNETYQELRNRITELDDAARAMYLVTKGADATRPVLDASGYSHRVPETDVFDCHDYEQDPEIFAKNHAGLEVGKPFINGPRNQPWSITYRDQPFFVSEFGGIWWNEELARIAAEQETYDDSWGYGKRPRTIEEFYERFELLCQILLKNPDMFGYCYTQLTDTFQEQNGIYDFHRRPKFDIDRIRDAQSHPPAIEQAASEKFEREPVPTG